MRPHALIAILFLAGCPGGDGTPDAGPCAVEVEWGHGVPPAFTGFRDGDSAELVLGFQGFRYVRSTMRLGGDVERGTFWFDIVVDGQEPYQSSAGTRDLLRSGDDSYAAEVLVFFNDIPMPELLGRSTTVIAHARADGCDGRHVARVTVVDDEDCIEAADGGLVCSDAGP
jgi:hypothetical protein